MFLESLKQLCQKYLNFTKTIENRYKLFYKLGEGRYGKVYLCLDLKTSNLVALKILKKNPKKKNLLKFYKEIKNLSKISRIINKNIKIAKLLDFSFSGKFGSGKRVVFYVMDFLEIGELFCFLDLEEEVSEDMARYFVKEIILSVEKLHFFEIYHFDLKPENILVGLQGDVFLCDFGHSFVLDEKFYKEGLEEKKDFKNDKPFGEKNIKNWENQDFLGSFEYSAPEVYELEKLKKNSNSKNFFLKKIEEYNLQKLDTFSIGVTLFVIYLKSFPFSKADPKNEYYNLFITENKKFWEIFENIRIISKEFKNLINKMLTPENQKRPILSDVLKHPFFLKNGENGKMRENLEMLVFEKKNILKNKISEELLKNYEKYKERGFVEKKEDLNNEVFEIFFLEFEDKILELKNNLKSNLLVEEFEVIENKGVRKYSL